MSVKISEKTYKDYGNCVFMENGVVSLGVTIDVGPRIIYFSLEGKENIMFEDTERKFHETNEYGTWNNYGGHRLWFSPELVPETYLPDNSKVEYETNGNTVTFTPPKTALDKIFRISVTMSDSEAKVEVAQSIENASDKPLDYAAWSITGLRPGGVSKVPMVTRKSGYLPNRVVSFWDYTDLDDSRFKLTAAEARLRQDHFIKKAFKVGFNVEEGFSCYAVAEQIFVKCFPEYQDVKYPDYSCNYETYTNDSFLECEVLSEMRTYAPGEKACVTETWYLFDNPKDREPELDDIRSKLGK